MSNFKLNVLIMSGVEDGTRLEYDPSHGDGETIDTNWHVTIGRKDENDVCLRNDTYVSRYHARIIWRDGVWHLKDLDSTNGTFIENQADFFNDEPVTGEIRIDEWQLFRVGRTWLKFHTVE